MATIVYRSDSPYMPRPIEAPRKAPAFSIVASNAPPLRILIASRRSDPAVATEGLYAGIVSHALAEAGHHVEVVSAPPYPDLDSRVKLIEVPSFIRLSRPILAPLEKLEKMLGNRLEPLLFDRALTVLAKRRPGDFDLVLDNQTLSPGVLTLKRNGAALIAVIHDPQDLKRRSQWSALRHADAIIVSSARSSAALSNALEVEPAKIAVITRGEADRAALLIANLYHSWRRAKPR